METRGPLGCPACFVCWTVWHSIIIHILIRTISDTILMSTFALFLQPCSSETGACNFIMEAQQSPQQRPRFDGSSDVLVLRKHVRIPTCLDDPQLHPDFLKKLAPLFRDLRKSQTNLSFKPLQEKRAFLNSHRSTARRGASMTKTWNILAVDCMYALGEGVFSCCFTVPQTTVRDRRQIEHATRGVHGGLARRWPRNAATSGGALA